MYVTLTKRQKMQVARSIVQTIRGQDPPGRFLARDPETELWFDIGRSRALEKTSQALREKPNGSSSSNNGSSGGGAMASPGKGAKGETETKAADGAKRKLDIGTNVVPPSPAHSAPKKRKTSFDAAIETREQAGSPPAKKETGGGSKKDRYPPPPEITIPEHLEAQFRPRRQSQGQSQDQGQSQAQGQSQGQGQPQVQSTYQHNQGQQLQGSYQHNQDGYQPIQQHCSDPAQHPRPQPQEIISRHPHPLQQHTSYHSVPSPPAVPPARRQILSPDRPNSLALRTVSEESQGSTVTNASSTSHCSPLPSPPAPPQHAAAGPYSNQHCQPPHTPSAPAPAPHSPHGASIQGPYYHGHHCNHRMPPSQRVQYHPRNSYHSHPQSRSVPHPHGTNTQVHLQERPQAPRLQAHHSGHTPTHHSQPPPRDLAHVPHVMPHPQGQSQPMHHGHPPSVEHKVQHTVPHHGTYAQVRSQPQHHSASAQSQPQAIGPRDNRKPHSLGSPDCPPLQHHTHPQTRPQMQPQAQHGHHHHHAQAQSRASQQLAHSRAHPQSKGHCHQGYEMGYSSPNQMQERMPAHAPGFPSAAEVPMQNKHDRPYHHHDDVHEPVWEQFHESSAKSRRLSFDRADAGFDGNYATAAVAIESQQNCQASASHAPPIPRFVHEPKGNVAGKAPDFAPGMASGSHVVTDHNPSNGMIVSQYIPSSASGGPRDKDKSKVPAEAPPPAPQSAPSRTFDGLAALSSAALLLVEGGSDK